MKKIIGILLISIFFNSCSEYQKVLKSTDVEKKFEMGSKMYEAQKYNKSIRLFEQIAPLYRGKPNSDKLYYTLAQSYYKTEQYVLSGYQFESYVSNYPKSEKEQEAAFLGAKSYYMLSPEYSLDQTDTDKAIEKIQSFIDTYPNSSFTVEANVLMKVLTGKLEKKVFENAKGYYTISDFKSAIVALENFINDYPGTSFRDEALYYKLNSGYQLATNSVPSKKVERLNSAKVFYANLIKANKNSIYREKADTMLHSIESQLKNIK